MALVHEPIEDRVRQRRLAEVRVPLIDRQLADDHRGLGSDPIVEDLEQMRPVLRRGRRQPPVIERDQVDLGGLAQERRVAALGMCDPQVLEQPRQSPVPDRSPLPPARPSRSFPMPS